MKRWKKISAWLLGLGMAVAMLGTAPESVNAAEQKTGSITVHKFLIESQTDYDNLLRRANGNKIDIASDEQLKNLKPLADIGFKLTQVKDVPGATPENAQPMEGGRQEELTTNAKGELKFADLPLGLYKLEELDDNRVKEKMKPVLISVPTYNPEHKTNPQAQEFLYDVYVYPKNLIYSEGPEIDKDVITEGNQDGAVDIGEDFNWIITTDIPTDVVDDKTVPREYIIYDVLDSRLDFVKVESVKVRSKDKTQTEDFVSETDYTFTRKDVEGQSTDSGRSLTWTLTETGRGKLPKYSGGQVVITFTTRLNSTADLGTAIPNGAQLDYTNWEGHRYTPESPKPEVHTGGVSILKVDKADPNKKLAGAKFKIYTSEEDAKAGQNAVQMRNESGVLVDYEVTSSEDGIARFVGLAYGNPTGSKPTEGETPYWIVETEAPTVDGVKYNRLHDPVKVFVNLTSHTAKPETYTIYNAKDNYELPFTGGTGILIFLIGGAILLGVSYLVSGRKKTTK